jgi:hypothetical protein
MPQHRDLHIRRIRQRAETNQPQHPPDDQERDGPSHHDRQPASEPFVLVSVVTPTWHPSRAGRDRPGRPGRSRRRLRRQTFLTGTAGGGPLPDIGWYDSTGEPMTVARWQDPTERFLAVLLAGDRVDGVDEAGLPRTDDDVLVAVNAGTSPVEFPVPRSAGRRVPDHPRHRCRGRRRGRPVRQARR